MIKRLVISILILFNFYNNLTAGEKKEKDRLMVFDLVPEVGIEKGVVNLITEIVINEVTKINKYEVIGQKDLDKMLFWESQKNLKNCTESSCWVQIAGAMGAKYYVEGSVGVIGSNYIINLKLIDAEGVKIIKRETRQIARNEDVLLKEVKVLVKEIFGTRSDEEKKDMEEIRAVVKVGESKGDLLTYTSIGMGAIGIGIGITGTIFLLDVKGDVREGRYEIEVDARRDISKWEWISGSGYTIGGIGLIYGVYRLIYKDGDEKDKKGALKIGGGINYISMEARW